MTPRTDYRLAFACRATLSLFALLALVPPSPADVSKVTFMKESPQPPGEKFTLTDRMFEDFYQWKPGKNNGKGALITNGTNNEVKDFHIKVTGANDEFDDASSGGDLFDVKKIKDGDKIKELEFTLKPGVDPIKNKGSFWLEVGTTGNITFQGLVTPKVEKKKEEKRDEMNPCLGNDPIRYAQQGPSPLLLFDQSSQMLTLRPGQVNFAEYRDGTTATTNSALETILGSDIRIDPMRLIGPSSALPGAYLLSDSFLSIDQGASDFLRASLVSAFVIPDASVTGFDTLLQATLIYEESQADLVSRYLGEHHGIDTGLREVGEEKVLFIRSNLLSQTGSLTQSGSSTGTVVISSAAIPEPATLVLLAVGVLPLGGALRRRLGT